MTENQRLKILINKLNFKSQADFANAIEIKQGSLSDILRAKKGLRVSNSIKFKLENLYNVNLSWLETGDGEMFKLANTVSEPVVEYQKLPGTPMFDSAAMASELEVYDDNANEGPAFYVSIPQFKDCKFGKMIYGHSMYPTIESGTYIFCKPVADKHFFPPGEIFYIEIDNYALCKRLQLGNTPGYAMAVSDNDELRKDGQKRYEPFPIEIDKIRKMYLVKGFFKQSQN